MRHSNSKKLPYYFNPAEKNSRWEPPLGTDVEKLKVYMAKYHSGSIPAGGGAEDGKIRAAHLLVKHAESRRPSSWREVSRLPPPLLYGPSVSGWGHWFTASIQFESCGNLETKRAPVTNPRGTTRLRLVLTTGLLPPPLGNHHAD